MSQAVERALQILNVLNRQPETPCGLGEVSKLLGLTAPTCARLLKTLVENGYAEQVGRKKGYLLGPMAYALGGAGPYRKDVTLLAEPVVEAAARDLGETILIATVVRGRWVVLCEADGQQAVVARKEACPSLEATYHTATGRTLLAYMNPAEREAVLARCGPPPSTAWPEAHGPGGVPAALARIREHGIALKQSPEAVAMGFPVRQHERVVAALGCHMPRYRYETEHGPRVVERLRADAEALSARLSGEERPIAKGIGEDEPARPAEPPLRVHGGRSSRQERMDP